MSGKEKGPLTELQQEIINASKSLEESKEFYFTGGSALSAYYLHHRLSEDLDFFSSTEDLIQLVSKKLEAFEAFKYEGTEKAFCRKGSAVVGGSKERRKIVFERKIRGSKIVEEFGS